MKNTKTTVTPVQFLIHEMDGERDLFAFFPTSDWTDGSKLTKECYSIVGEHSACSVAYAMDSREATPCEYEQLKMKLESIGYTLHVVNRVNKGDSITIIGRRWFDRVNGNTYFSAVALINGKQVAEIPYEYGYGNQYEQSMFNKLFGMGYCADRESYSNGGTEAFWKYCDRKGITKYVTHSDVNRKKDL